MKYLFLICLWISSFGENTSLQLVIVIAQDWNTSRGELFLYEKTDKEAPWQKIPETIPVVLGENGLGWGIGLHEMKRGALYKKEGDRKSPAGIFSLGNAFGFGLQEGMQNLKLEYLVLNESIEAIDDPLSCYYNQIVDRRNCIPDWSSSEKMEKEPLYELGLEVHHNFPNPKAGAGSAIFLHLWEDEFFQTAGCTAMQADHLKRILLFLDPKKNPLFVQLPIEEYEALQRQWDLPLIECHLELR